MYIIYMPYTVSLVKVSICAITPFFARFIQFSGADDKWFLHNAHISQKVFLLTMKNPLEAQLHIAHCKIARENSQSSLNSEWRELFQSVWMLFMVLFSLSLLLIDHIFVLLKPHITSHHRHFTNTHNLKTHQLWQHGSIGSICNVNYVLISDHLPVATLRSCCDSLPLPPTTSPPKSPPRPPDRFPPPLSPPTSLPPLPPPTSPPPLPPNSLPTSPQRLLIFLNMINHQGNDHNYNCNLQ